MMLVAIQMTAAGIVQTLFGIAVGETDGFQISQVSATSWLAVAYLVVFGSLITSTAYVWLLHASTPARVSTYAFVNPLIAVALGCTIGAEPFSTKLLISTALIVVAVYAIITHQSKKSPEPEVQTQEA